MKKFLGFVMILMLGTLLTGCLNQEEKEEKQMNIVTSFYPMYIATANIIDGVENVKIVCLASPSVGCLHDYQLTVADMITLETADVFVINGGGMESFLEKAISTYPKMQIVNASDGLISQEDNAHIWVSISLYIEEIKNITNQLLMIDPSNASKYQENASSYIKKLELLKEEMHQNLDQVTQKNIVTFHEAFDYFAEEFGLHLVAVIEREPGTAPSAREIADIIEKVKAEDVNAIFTEPQYSKTAADTIAKETKVRVYELDPVVTGELEKDAYEKAMKKNLEVLMEALHS